MKKRKKLTIYQKETIFGYLMISPWLLGFIIFIAGSMIASIYLSFTNWRLIGDASWVGLENYRTMLFEDPRFWKALYNTAYYTFIAVPLGALGSLLLALLMNQKVHGIRVYRTFYYLPVVTSGVATAILWAWIFNPRLGLLNYLLGLIGINGPDWLLSEVWSKPAFIVMSLWGIGGMMVIFLAGLQSIPEVLYESSTIDGANWWHKFRHITLPMLSPTTFFVLVMGIIGSFQIFTSAFVITNGGPADSTLFYVLYLYQNAFQYFRMGYASALAWILFIIIFVFTFIQFRLAKRWVYYEALR